MLRAISSWRRRESESSWFFSVFSVRGRPSSLWRFQALAGGREFHAVQLVGASDSQGKLRSSWVRIRLRVLVGSIGAAGSFPVGVLTGVELGGRWGRWKVMPAFRTEAAVSSGALSCLFGVFSLWRSLPGWAVARTVLSKRLGRRMDRRSNKVLQRTPASPALRFAARPFRAAAEHRRYRGVGL